MLTAGKIGIYDAVDARTGEWVFSIDLGLNNIVTEIDARTGEKLWRGLQSLGSERSADAVAEQVLSLFGPRAVAVAR